MAEDHDATSYRLLTNVGFLGFGVGFFCSIYNKEMQAEESHLLYIFKKSYILNLRVIETETFGNANFKGTNLMRQQLFFCFVFLL